MSSTANRFGGLELETFSGAPPSIAVTAPGDVIDAGLRSLDHCMFAGGFYHLVLSSVRLQKWLGR